MNASQCRMARAALKMGVRELARAAMVSPTTLVDFESEKRTHHPRTIEAIRKALEAAGVQFIQEKGGCTGVSLKKTVSGGTAYWG